MGMAEAGCQSEDETCGKNFTETLHTVLHEPGAAGILGYEDSNVIWLTFSKSDPSYTTAVKSSWNPMTRV
jgi:hypothetical protein